MSNRASKTSNKGNTGTIVRRVMLTVYFVAIAMLLFSYVRILPDNHALKSKLSDLTNEKSKLVELELETKEAAKKVSKLNQRREAAQIKAERAIRQISFDDLNFEDAPFFVASYRILPKKIGMEVIVNLPRGDQRFKVAFPSQADLKLDPISRKDHWFSDSLHFQSSKEVTLESGNCYEVTYKLNKESETTFISATIRTKEKLIYNHRFPYTLKGVRTQIYGAGTRNTIFIPGEVLKPFVLTMKGVQRPRVWEWGLFESRGSFQQKPFVHNLRFTYENEPTAFLSPSTMVRFEQRRRFYKWKPLGLSDVFEINEAGDRFNFKVFPRSKGRSSTPLY